MKGRLSGSVCRDAPQCPGTPASHFCTTQVLSVQSPADTDWTVAGRVILPSSESTGCILGHEDLRPGALWKPEDMGGNHNCSHFPVGGRKDSMGAPHEHSKASHGPWMAKEGPHGGWRCRGLIRQSYNASPLFFLLPGASVQPPHFFSDLRFFEIPSKQTFAQNLKTTKAKYLHTLQSPSSQEARSHTRPPS